jgi:hypothetical protein
MRFLFRKNLFRKVVGSSAKTLVVADAEEKVPKAQNANFPSSKTMNEAREEAFVSFDAAQGSSIYNHAIIGNLSIADWFNSL